MKKNTKTKIAFVSILSLIPLLVLVKLNLLSVGIGITLTIIATILFIGFGREFINDFDDKTKW